jgi:hypothetical protein
MMQPVKRRKQAQPSLTAPPIERYLKTFFEELPCVRADEDSARCTALRFYGWRHLFEMLTAARALDLRLINICVWNKASGGMGHHEYSRPS